MASTCGLLLALALAGAGCSGPTPTNEPLEPYSILSSLSTNSIRIGEPMVLTLEAAHPTNAQFQLPDLGREREVVVRDVRLSTRPESEGLVRTTAIIQFTSMKAGDHILSSNEVYFVGDGTEPVVRPFPFVTYEVRTLLGEDSEAREEKPIREWPGRVPMWVVGLALVAILAFAIGSLVAWRMRRPAIVSAPPQSPAHVSALRAMERLREKGYIQSGALDPFYVELSDIVRLYIERRFDLHAPDRTTEEFIRDAVNSNLLSGEHQDLTRCFLEQCDLVKFARARPGAPEMESAFASGRQLIDETAEKEDRAA